MKILLIGTDTKVFVEGSNVRERMVNYGAIFERVHVVVFSRIEDNFKMEKISQNIWIHPTNSKYRFLYIWDYWRTIRRQITFKGVLDADIISAQDPAETGIVAWLLALRYRKKLHLQIHTDIFNPYYKSESFRHRVHQILTSFLVPRADGIRVVSEKIKKDIIQRWNNIEHRVRVLPIYTDVEVLKNSKPSFDLHDRYKNYKFIILSIGRFGLEKNLLFMLDVFSEVIKRYRRAGLIIVGEGPVRIDLEEYLKENNLFANVVIEPWQDDLVSHYKTANLFLLTSVYEGHARTLVEAAAAGIPFVASDVGIASQLTPEQKKRLVCPVNDKACFVDKIMNFMSDQETRLDYTVNVRDTIADQINDNKEEYLEAYKDDFTKTFYFGEGT